MASLAAQLALPPPQLEFGQSGVSNGRGVWTKTNIPANTRFGPFLGKWVSGWSGKFYHRNNCFFFQVLEPENEEFAWEVRITILSYFAIFEFLPTWDG